MWLTASVFVPCGVGLSKVCRAGAIFQISNGATTIRRSAIKVFLRPYLLISLLVRGIVQFTLSLPQVVPNYLAFARLAFRHLSALSAHRCPNYSSSPIHCLILHTKSPWRAIVFQTKTYRPMGGIPKCRVSLQVSFGSC